MSNLDFSVGKRVVCIFEDYAAYLARLGYHATECPIKGQVYTLRFVTAWPQGVWFLLEEIHNAARRGRQLDGSSAIAEPSFPSQLFRPVRETSIDCFTALLAKPPVRLREDA